MRTRIRLMFLAVLLGTMVAGTAAPGGLAGPRTAQAATTIELCGTVAIYVKPTNLLPGAITVGVVPFVIKAGTSVPASVKVGANVCVRLTLDTSGRITNLVALDATATTTVRICGDISAYVKATSTTAGSLKIAGHTYPIATGTTLPAVIKAGADVCATLTLNVFGQIKDGTAVANTTATLEVCGKVTAYAAASATTDGTLTVAGTNEVHRRGDRRGSQRQGRRVCPAPTRDRRLRADQQGHRPEGRCQPGRGLRFVLDAASDRDPQAHAQAHPADAQAHPDPQAHAHPTPKPTPTPTGSALPTATAPGSSHKPDGPDGGVDGNEGGCGPAGDVHGAAGGFSGLVELERWQHGGRAQPARDRGHRAGEPGDRHRGRPLPVLPVRPSGPGIRRTSTSRPTRVCHDRCIRTVPAGPRLMLGRTLSLPLAPHLPRGAGWEVAVEGDLPATTDPRRVMRWAMVGLIGRGHPRRPAHGDAPPRAGDHLRRRGRPVRRVRDGRPGRLPRAMASPRRRVAAHPGGRVRRVRGVAQLPDRGRRFAIFRDVRAAAGASSAGTCPVVRRPSRSDWSSRPSCGEHSRSTAPDRSTT